MTSCIETEIDFESAKAIYAFTLLSSKYSTYCPLGYKQKMTYDISQGTLQHVGASLYIKLFDEDYIVL